MFVRSLSALVAVAASASLLVGCDGAIPSTPIIGDPNLGPAPSIQGTVKGVSGTNLRVGLLGSKSAGQTKVELVSTSATGSSFTLQLPSQPGLDKMSSDSESIIFTLTAYEDKNSNGKFDTGDVETDAGVSGGTFRFFAEENPNGPAGWYQYKGGKYTRSFDTAFNMTPQS